jgi:hypothetical protein
MDITLRERVVSQLVDELTIQFRNMLQDVERENDLLRGRIREARALVEKKTEVPSGSSAA